jgi:hypothetical protein
VPLSREDRSALIDRYARGPALLKASLAKVPKEALKWRPGANKWSAHEVIVHCADAETNAHARIRYLLAEAEPTIQAYDQERWAQVLNYHERPLEPALATVEAVRANTVPLLRAMTERDWQRVGRHTESGHYGAEEWLKIYAEHLEKHSGQIERNLAAWTKR